jgi:hypothetical protein
MHTGIAFAPFNAHELGSNDTTAWAALECAEPHFEESIEADVIVRVVGIKLLDGVLYQSVNL